MNSAPAGWVDFRAIKDAVSLEQVLVRYGVKLTPRGEALVGRCPIHKGVRNSNAFHVSPGKNAWKCFGDCRAGGNQLDFVMRMEGVDLRTSAQLISQWFMRDETPAVSKASERVTGAPTGRARPVCEHAVHDGPPVASTGPSTGVNRPLPFELRFLDPTHPYLAARGLQGATIDTFGLGFCAKGLMEKRIAIPLHDAQGRLLAYAGRAVDEAHAEAEGKYRFPPDFKKSQMLFNLHRAVALAPSHGLVVVEGFFSAFHLHQAGIPNVVALMGSTLSDAQEALLLQAVGTTGRVTLMLDRDDTGRAATNELVQRLMAKTHIRMVPYEARQPDELTSDELRQLFDFESRRSAS